MSHRCFSVIAFTCLGLPAVPATQPAPPVPEAGNRVVTALRFAHAHAKPEALTPAGDRRLKTALIAALAKSDELPWEVASGFFDRDTFRATGGAGPLTVAQMERTCRAAVPQSRKDMHARLRQHADLLTTQFDTIDEAHRKPAEELVEWVVKGYAPDRELGVIVMCTGNTRRSVLGATTGNVAAAYYGLPNVRFHCGGTDPDAINPRTVATLKEAGVEIEPTGAEAPRGRGNVPNPIYRVCWGKGMETKEFSKKFTDAANPQRGFAALLVCSEADEACPQVPGAGARIPLPYLDPKAFDGAPFEGAKYAERRDDMGRFMLSVMMQARRRLEADGKLK